MRGRLGGCLAGWVGGGAAAGAEVCSFLLRTVAARVRVMQKVWV